MKGGFSFCGTDIADFSLEYAPELEDTYVYRPAKTTIHEQTFEGHHGGYFYGMSYEPKEFILRCIFEEKVIDKGFLSNIQSFFRVGKSGKLIFKRREWCYYYATVVEYDDTGITNYLNGIIKITMKAYYPFAQCDYMYYTRKMKNFENVRQNTALYETEDMQPILSFSNIDSNKNIIIGNPGSVKAKVSIIASGNVGSGVIIHNHTNDTEVRLVAMSKIKTTDIGKQLRIDGISGKTTLDKIATDSQGEEYIESSEISFLYHDYGFLELDPAFPAKRDIYIRYTPGTIIKTLTMIYGDYSGKYLFADGQWRKIIKTIDKQTLEIDENNPVENTGSQRTMIMKMNEISIMADDSMDLSKLSFIFKPAFA